MPLLIVFKGHPGVGKSTVARAVAQRLGVPLIDKDDIKDILDDGRFDAGGPSYNVMFNVARRQLLNGLNVICDSPLSQLLSYTSAQRVAREANARLVVVECMCSAPEEWRRRVDQRGALNLPAHHITTWQGLQALLDKRGDSSQYPIDAPHLVINTIEPLETLVDRIIVWLMSH